MSKKTSTPPTPPVTPPAENPPENKDTTPPAENGATKGQPWRVRLWVEDPANKRGLRKSKLEVTRVGSVEDAAKMFADSLANIDADSLAAIRKIEFSVDDEMPTAKTEAAKIKL